MNRPRPTSPCIWYASAIRAHSVVCPPIPMARSPHSWKTEDPPTDQINAGCYVFRRELIEQIRRVGPFRLSGRYSRVC